jgi:hypothetical protein
VAFRKTLEDSIARMKNANKIIPGRGPIGAGEL